MATPSSPFEYMTPYGRVRVLKGEEIFGVTLGLLREAAAGAPGAAVGLTGGSTPKAFYAWAARQAPELAGLAVDWTVSDERCVPLESAESNFGLADRALFTPLRFDRARLFPWPADLAPADAAARFEAAWRARHPRAALDLCFLGMGDDAHTASLFPDSPLLAEPPAGWFAPVFVPGKGWRWTITPAGLGTCGRIVVTALGEGKAATLKKVFHGEHDPRQRPVQLLREHAATTLWLLDAPAAALLRLA